MKKIAFFFPFLLCFFSAALPGAQFLAGGTGPRPDLLILAVSIAGSLAGGLLLFFLCTKKDWISHRTQTIYMIAAAALIAAFVLGLLLGRVTFWLLALADAAAAFLFGYALIFAEEHSSNILHIGIAAGLALTLALFLAICLAQLAPAVLPATGVAAGIFFYILAFFQRPLLFPDALPLYEKKASPRRPAADVGRTREERLQKFAEAFDLTARETEVLSIVVDNECTLKEVAFNLNISERMVQRYMTSIYHKTDTQSRIGLSLRYFGQD